MRTTLAVLVVLLMGARVDAQSCIPTPVIGMTNWSDGRGGASPVPADALQGSGIPESTNIAHVFSLAVPAGKFWILSTISLSTATAVVGEFMVEHLRVVPGGYHFHSMIPSHETHSTPAVGVPAGDLRWDPFLPGDRIGYRTNGGSPIFGMWGGMQYDLACLGRALGMEAPIASGGTSTPPPDFSAAIQALQELSTAADTLKTTAATAAQALP